jgi:hypothetical protein
VSEESEAAHRLPFLGIFEPEPGEVAREPLDFVHVERLWELARQELEQAAEWEALPDGAAEFIESPHLDVLKKRIQLHWFELGDAETLASCLELVRKMHSKLSAALLGYTLLRVALLEANHIERAEEVADLDSAYRLQHSRSTEERDANRQDADTDSSGGATTEA